MSSVLYLPLYLYPAMDIIILLSLRMLLRRKSKCSYPRWIVFSTSLRPAIVASPRLEGLRKRTPGADYSYPPFIITLCCIFKIDFFSWHMLPGYVPVNMSPSVPPSCIEVCIVRWLHMPFSTNELLRILRYHHSRVRIGWLY